MASFELCAGQAVQISIKYEHSKMVSLSTNSPFIDHFLRTIKMTQSDNTWINYTHDLKVFFSVLKLSLEQVDRKTCLRFIEQQDQAGYSSLTINRRLAAISSLFIELNLIDPDLFPHNPVAPLQRSREIRKRGPSLYRRQPDRVPDIVAESDLQAFFEI
jgi:site-specific recombinase XerD